MLTFETSRSAALLEAFKDAIEEGRVATWEDDKDGYFSHKAERWKRKAWFRYSETSTGLTFHILLNDNATPVEDRRAVYSYYHGHLLETFTNHFADRFGRAVCTSNPSASDSPQAL